MTLDTKLFYDYNKLMSYNATFNFLVGARGLGKTYGAKKIAIQQFLKHGHQTIYLRRFNTDLLTRETFFADIQESFPDYLFSVEGMTGRIAKADSIDDNGKVPWQTFIYFVALSNAQNKKSVSYHNVRTIIYDEFILAPGPTHYLPSETNVFNEFYNTVDRWRDKVKVLFLSNSVSIMNPFLIDYGLIPKEGEQWLTRHKKGDGSPFIVANFPNALGFKEAVSKTEFGKFIIKSDPEYATYAMGNWFADNTQVLIGRKTEKARYHCSIELKDITLAIWSENTDKGAMYFCQEKRPGHELLFTLNPDRMSEEKIMLLGTDEIVQSLRTSFRQGRVLFDSPKSRNAFGEFFKR